MQDEAWKAHVEEYDRDRFDSTSRHRRHCFDAGWEAALADTLGLLEALAKMVGEVHTKKWWISYDKHTDQFTYRRYLYFSFSGDSITATRAEVEALPGKGKAK